MRLREYALFIAFVHLAVFATIIFNIPILRQLSLFIYLSFIPGFVFIGILKVEKISLLDLALCSLGLSIALDMFVGLFINEVYPLLGISQPLSTIPIFLTMSVFTSVLFVLGCRRGIANILDSLSCEKLAQFPIVKASLLMLLPIFSVISVLYARETIPIIPIVIATLSVVCVLSSKFIPVKLYPLLVFAVSLSLALQLPLMTEHIIGTDSFLEFYVYKLTANGERWLTLNMGVFPQSALNSMLSITILPTVYSALLNLSGEIVFKLFYPVVFSFVPVVIYRIFAHNRWNLAALLSALFFVSGSVVFYGVEPLGVDRQIVGAFFLLLSLFLLVGKPFSIRNNQIILIIFGAALAVSHYTLAIIYLTFLVLVFIFFKVKKEPESILNGKIIFLLFVITFGWYLVSSSYILNHISTLINYIVSNFRADFFNNGARPSEVFSTHQVRTIASSINWILYITVNLLMIVGILVTILNKQSIRVDFKFLMMILLCSILLFLSVVVPNFSSTFNFSRFYEVGLLFLAPCFVIGGLSLFVQLKKVSNLIFKPLKINLKRSNIVLLLVAIILSAYFLSSYGFINRYAGAPQSYVIDWKRIVTSNDPILTTQLHYVYVPEQDITSATWLSAVLANSSIIYSDFISNGIILKVYGMIQKNVLLTLTNETTIEPNSYIYLRTFNIIYGSVTPSVDWEFNTTQLSPLLSNNNCIYSNGASVIYASP